MPDAARPLLLLDAASLYYRAFFGDKGTIKAPDGAPVGAVRGFLDMIAYFVRERRPSGLVACWDDDWRPAFRVEAVPSYKAHRLAADGGEDAPPALGPQVDIIVEVLAAVGIARVGAAGCEADDVIGTLTTRAVEAGEQVEIATGDRDLFQLVDDDTSIVYVARGVAKHELVTPEVLAAKYALDASRYVDFAVLRGDPSDGLPGVKGIGEKSAAGLVAAYPTLEAIVEAATDPASGMSPAMRAKLTADVGYLARAREVVTAVDTLALPDLTRRPVNHDKVEELTERYALGGALTRLAATAR